MTVHCDWLDLTYSTGEGLHEDILSLLSPITVKAEGEGDRFYTHIKNDTFILLESRKSFYRVSCSGSFLSELRFYNLFSDFLSVLGCYPHKITRLDAAHDTPEDGAKVFKYLKRRYTSSLVYLTRKGVKMTLMSAFRELDGKESGTIYAGYRSKARVSARVYDKQLEQFQRKGLVIGSLTRYELTLRTDSGVTLRDAYNPESVFWHFMAKPFFPKACPDVLPWIPHAQGRHTEPVERKPLHDRLYWLLENSLDLHMWEKLAEEAGPTGVTILKKKFKSILANLES